MDELLGVDLRWPPRTGRCWTPARVVRLARRKWADLFELRTIASDGKQPESQAGLQPGWILIVMRWSSRFRWHSTHPDNATGFSSDRNHLTAMGDGSRHADRRSSDAGPGPSGAYLVGTPKSTNKPNRSGWIAVAASPAIRWKMLFEDDGELYVLATRPKRGPCAGNVWSACCANSVRSSLPSAHAHPTQAGRAFGFVHQPED